MRNAICSEFLKIRKNKMALLGMAIVILLPILLILKGIFLDGINREYHDWFMTVSMVTMLVFPIVSGFVITTMVQKEYQDKTLRNILTAPTSRSAFVVAKALVWLLWYIITLVFSEIVVVAGIYILFPDELSITNLHYAVFSYTQSCLFSFVAMLPVLWIAIKQTALFYPSILATLGFTVLQMAGRQITEELLLPASLCPWTAVSISGMVQTGTLYWIICTISILSCGIIGFAGAIQCFTHQDQ